jgi:hypothetical protein
MFAPMIHFALCELTDQTKHRAENELQQLYHLPELLALPGIAWGGRWAHDAECAAWSVCRADFEIDYASMFWLRAPATDNARLFTSHFARAAQKGLGSAQWSRTALDEFLVPLKGYAKHDRLVSDAALPFRPVKGIYLVVSRFHRHQNVEAEATFHWYDQVRIPDMLDCVGAVGVWTFASRTLFSPSGDHAEPILRINLFYLDGDPLEFAQDIANHEKGWRSGGRLRDTTAIEEVLFAGPLRTIRPWRWPQAKPRKSGTG